MKRPDKHSDYLLLFMEIFQEADRRLTFGEYTSSNTEDYFRIADCYWRQVKDLVKNGEFKSETEEIAFFKYVKPRFTSRIEYFAILSESLNFIHGATSEDSAIFWRSEMARFTRFSLKQKKLIGYFEKDDHVKDREYFLRKKNQNIHVDYSLFYDPDFQYSTLFDRVISRYLALKDYYDYAIREYVKVTGNFSVHSIHLGLTA